MEIWISEFVLTLVVESVIGLVLGSFIVESEDRLVQSLMILIFMIIRFLSIFLNLISLPCEYSLLVSHGSKSI